MKNVFTSLTAILLVIWYSLSVIGFDVHTCSGSGRTYIATVASGFSCADIHPDAHGTRAQHGQSCCKCCQKHNPDAGAETGGRQLDRKPCCTDDFQVILLTGVRCAQESDAEYVDGVEASLVCRNTVSDPLSSIINLSGLRAFYKPRSGGIAPRDAMVVYNIWRI